MASPGREKAQVLLTIGNKKFVCSEDELEKVQKSLSEGWKPKVRQLQIATGEVRALWDSHSEARKTTFFMIPALVDKFSGKPFPPESIVSRAEGTLAKFEAAVKSGNQNRTIDAFDDAHDAVSEALRTTRAYHEGVIGGSGSVVSGLEKIKTGSLVFLQIAAAFASGGASVGAQAAVAASVGSYEELIKQIESTSGSEKFDPLKSALTVLIKGSTEGLVTGLFEKTALASKIIDKVASKLAVSSLEGLQNALTRKVLERMWKDGMEAAAKSAVKDLIANKSFDSKMTLDDAAKHAAEESIKEVRLAIVLGLLDERLGAVAKGSIKYIKPEWFKGLSKVDYEAAMKKGGEKIIKEAFQRIAPKLVLDAAEDSRELEKVHVKIGQTIASDSKVANELSALAKKK